MFTTILFDMDNTLLENHNEVFSSGFFEGFASFVNPPVAMDELISAFIAVDEIIDTYSEGKFTTAELFRDTFYLALGRTAEETEPQMMRFLAEGFPRLRHLTHPLPYARRVMELTFEKTPEVVIATGMYLPQSCLEERLAWAGVPVTDFDYHFLTTWDNMHTGKATAAYYHELLEHLGRQPTECLMVGDSLKVDMIPAIEVGIPAYLAVLPDREPPDHDLDLVGQGTLEDFYNWLARL